MNQPISRPTGVTIVAILQIIGGLFLLLAGLGTFISGEAILTELAQQNPEIPQDPSFLPVLGAIFLVFAAIAFFLAYGLFKLKGWAWIAILVLQGLGLFSNISSLISNPSNAAGAIFSLTINAIIIYYFLTPPIKRAFGRSA